MFSDEFDQSAREAIRTKAAWFRDMEPPVSEESISKSLITANGTAKVPMKFFFPKALMPFLTPTPESFWLNVVVGMRMWRIPR